MKLTLALTIAAVLVVAGCAGQDPNTTSAPVATVTVTASPAYTPPTTDDYGAPNESDDPPTLDPYDKAQGELFVTYVREHGSSWFDTASKETIIETGRAVCPALDAGMTPTDVLEVAMGEGMSPDDAGVFVGAAVGLWCPGTDWS